MTEAFWQRTRTGPSSRSIASCAALATAVVVTLTRSSCRTSVTDARDLADHATLTDRNVMVVQTKASRMGMYLMGQALFSARLALACGAKSVRAILLCTAPDSVLLPLLKDFPEVEVWVYERSSTCRRVSPP